MADAPEPSRTIALTCKADPAHGWEAPVLTGVTVGQWIAGLEAQACPKCGAAYQLTSQRKPA